MLVLCDGWRGLLLAPIPSQQELDAGTTPTQPEEMQQLLKGDGQYLVRIANGVTEMLDGHHYVTDSCVHSDVGRVSSQAPWAEGGRGSMNKVLCATFM